MLTINFEFVGGPNDGKLLRGQLGDASDAERYYLFTNHGHVGQRFKVASDFAVEALAQEHAGDDESRHSFQTHHYVVTERLEEDEEILIRAAYVEKEAEPVEQQDYLRTQRRFSPVEVESSEEKIRRYLRQTATVMGQSYAQCWPADAPEKRKSAASNISLHFAHVLLNEHFSVFANAEHADAAIDAIDLLGISPAQDWFLACQFSHLYSVDQLGEMLEDLNQLETFWLSRRLAIDACGEHISRVAKHCESGYGLAAGLHWVSESDHSNDLLEFWTARLPGDHRLDEFTRKLDGLGGAVRLAPVSVRHDAGRGSYCLLAVSFRLPHDPR